MGLFHSLCGQCLNKSFEEMHATTDRAFATVVPIHFDFTRAKGKLEDLNLQVPKQLKEFLL